MVVKRMTLTTVRLQDEIAVGLGPEDPGWCLVCLRMTGLPSSKGSSRRSTQDNPTRMHGRSPLAFPTQSPDFPMLPPTDANLVGECVTRLRCPSPETRGRDLREWQPREDENSGIGYLPPWLRGSS